MRRRKRRRRRSKVISSSCSCSGCCCFFFFLTEIHFDLNVTNNRKIRELKNLFGSGENV